LSFVSAFPTQFHRRKNGERDAPLEQLEKIAAPPGCGPASGDLLLNPCWDDLRGDPRFDKIVAAAKAASK
jgi:hypothetical protein